MESSDAAALHEDAYSSPLLLFTSDVVVQAKPRNESTLSPRSRRVFVYRVEMQHLPSYSIIPCTHHTTTECCGGGSTAGKKHACDADLHLPRQLTQRLGRLVDRLRAIPSSCGQALQSYVHDLSFRGAPFVIRRANAHKLVYNLTKQGAACPHAGGSASILNFTIYFIYFPTCDWQSHVDGHSSTESGSPSRYDSPAPKGRLRQLDKRTSLHCRKSSNGHAGYKYGDVLL